MDQLEPIEERILASFHKQGLMKTLNAQIVRVAPGNVEIAMSASPTISQQHGYMHAGAVTSVLDTACGYAALTLMPSDDDVLSVEFKANLLAPALGDSLLAAATVIRAGRTLTVARGEAYAISSGKRVHVATMTATLIRIPSRKPRE